MSFGRARRAAARPCGKRRVAVAAAEGARQGAWKVAGEGQQGEVAAGKPCRSAHLGHLEKDRLASLAVLLVADRGSVKVERSCAASTRSWHESEVRSLSSGSASTADPLCDLGQQVLFVGQLVDHDGRGPTAHPFFPLRRTRERERERAAAAPRSARWKGGREARRRGACAPAGPRQTHKSCTARRSRWTPGVVRLDEACRGSRQSVHVRLRVCAREREREREREE